MHDGREGKAMRDETSVKIQYDDAIARQFMWATLIWGLVGMLVGLLAALELAWWPANSGLPWITFGRLRPIHTNAVIFAFAANAFFAGLYYSLQRLLKTRMWSDALSRIHFWGWQLIILATAVSLALGYTQGKEYAEMEWSVDLAITVVWVIMTINVFGTLLIRRVQHLYVAIWFYLASILTIAMLHIVNNLCIPISPFKSYSLFAGVQDALVQWWYGHNAVGFLLTTPFLGLMYYFIPKHVEQPVYSYRLSIIHFWALVFIYIWAGPHHLLYSALPEWAQSLGMVFSIMLLAPSWGGMINGLLTMRGAWGRLREDPIMKFFVMALTFYGMATLEGPLLSIKSLNLLSHYTDWTIAHVHGGALGWVGGMVFGMFYWMAPKLYRRPLYSTSLANTHFWFATAGLLFYTISMWTAGIMQGLMWFAVDSDGVLRYPNFMETVTALLPLYWFRVLGGALYITGVLVCIYNIYKTATASDAVVKDATELFHDDNHVAPRTWHERLEGKAMALAVLTFFVAAIGGLAEFIPAFMVESVVPTLSNVKPYTHLELHGRDIYLREGCYNCHSQMVRTQALEEMRYGRHSEAGEFVYDHPFQWGSKRTGPDLHRVGGKYPNIWHYRHLVDPRSTSPGSIMPAYTWLVEDKVDLTFMSKKISAMMQLGVPYTKDDQKHADQLYLEQAHHVVSSLAKDNITVAPDSEIIALIAYLQRLGTDINK